MARFRIVFLFHANKYLVRFRRSIECTHRIRLLPTHDAHCAIGHIIIITRLGDVGIPSRPYHTVFTVARNANNPVCTVLRLMWVGRCATKSRDVTSVWKKRAPLHSCAPVRFATCMYIANASSLFCYTNTVNNLLASTESTEYAANAAFVGVH